MSAIKSFEVSDPVNHSLRGFALANPSLTLVPDEKIVFRKTDKKHVGLIAGGGTGHEPTHAGFVGKGGLSAAVCGEIFASPSTKQILHAIQLVAENSNGVLLIVKNYTGDLLHFALSAERAKSLGIDCRVIPVSDDVAVGREKGGMVGRRALAGTVLVHKSTGAFSELYSEKYGIDGAEKVAQIVNDNLVSINSSLDHCKVPGRKFETELKSNQMELGMGIHNEPGVHVLEPIPSTEELIEKQMLPKMLDPNDKDRHFVDFNKNDETLLLVDNLGGVSNFIITAIASITVDLLKKNYGIEPVQVIAGTVMTSFDGNGFGLTLLNASGASKQLKSNFSEINSVFDLINATTDAPGWPVSSVPGQKGPSYNKDLFTKEVKVKDAGAYNYENFVSWMKGGAHSLIEAEPHITELDNKVGDGDCGYTLVAGAKGITNNLDKLSRKSLSEATAQISDFIESAMGGTSGGLYSILISGFSHGLIRACNGQETSVTPEIAAEAFGTALETLYKYTRARPGASTMVDALEPFIKEFCASKNFDKAVAAAEEGAKGTLHKDAKFGRASYVGDSASYEDPGAVGLVAFIKGVQSAYKH